MLFSPGGTSTPVNTFSQSNPSSQANTSSQADTSSQANPSSQPNTSQEQPIIGEDISIVEQTDIQKDTPHTKPGWLENVLKNFHRIIVMQCSARTRWAVDMNEVIMVCMIMGFVKIQNKL